MKKTIILLLLTVFGVCFAYPKHISVKQRELAFQHGRARMPSATRVTADYNNGIVTLNVTGYTGNVQVYVSDSQGNIVGYTMSSIVNRGNVTLDLGVLPESSYSLSIALDNTTYYGQFEA